MDIRRWWAPAGAAVFLGLAACTETAAPTSPVSSATARSPTRAATAAVLPSVTAEATVWPTEATPPAIEPANVTGIARFGILQAEGERYLADLAFSPDSRLIAAPYQSGPENWIGVWDLASGGLVFRIAYPESRVLAVAFSPDGSLLATGSNLGIVSLWSTDGWDLAGELRGPAHAIWKLEFSPDGSTLVSAGAHEEVWSWKLPAGEGEERFLGSKAFISMGLEFLPSGDYFVAASQGHQGTRVFPRHAGGPVRQFQGLGHTNGAVLSTDGSQLAILGDGVVVIETESWSTSYSLPGPPIRGADFSSDGQMIFVADEESRSIRALEAVSGRLVHAFGAYVRPYGILEVSPDGRVLAAVSYWEAQGGEIHLFGDRAAVGGYSLVSTRCSGSAAMFASFEVPIAPGEAYGARMGEASFTCLEDDLYPTRRFCLLPKSAPGTPLKIELVRGEDPAVVYSVETTSPVCYRPVVTEQGGRGSCNASANRAAAMACDFCGGEFVEYAAGALASGCICRGSYGARTCYAARVSGAWWVENPDGTYGTHPDVGPFTTCTSRYDPELGEQVTVWCETWP